MTDASAIARLCNDPTMSRWLATMPYPYTGFHARQFLRHMLSDHQRSGSAPGTFIVCLKSNPLIVAGMISIDERRGRFILGYWVARSMRNRGVTTEAARAIVNLAFERGIDRVTVDYMVGNEASRRVIRRLGFTKAGTRYLFSRFHGRRVLAVRSVLTRDRWISLNGPPK